MDDINPGPMPEPFDTERYFAGPHERRFNLYTDDQMRAYAAQEVAAERKRLAERFDAMQERALALADQHGERDDIANVMLRQIAHLGFGECARHLRSRSDLFTALQPATPQTPPASPSADRCTRPG